MLFRELPRCSARAFPSCSRALGFDARRTESTSSVTFFALDGGIHCRSQRPTAPPPLIGRKAKIPTTV